MHGFLQRSLRPTIYQRHARNHNHSGEHDIPRANICSTGRLAMPGPLAGPHWWANRLAVGAE